MSDGKWLTAAKAVRQQIKDATAKMTVWLTDTVGKSYAKGDTTLYLGIVYEATKASKKKLTDTPLGSDNWQVLAWWRD